MNYKIKVCKEDYNSHGRPYVYIYSSDRVTYHFFSMVNVIIYLDEDLFNRFKLICLRGLYRKSTVNNRFNYEEELKIILDTSIKLTNTKLTSKAISDEFIEFFNELLDNYIFEINNKG